MRCWGDNEAGQLGDGNGPQDAFAVGAPVPGLTGVVQIAASKGSNNNAFTCALVTGGAVKCWGSGTNGKLGNGDVVSSASPVDVTGITAATQISLGYDFACALEGGAVKCWGDGFYGQLGNDSTSEQSTPVPVSNLTAATQIAAGGYHACATSGGTALCWGRDVDFQLGDDESAATATADADQPVGVDHGNLFLWTGVVQMAAGGHSTCMLTSDGQVHCWGDDSDGQIGDGPVDNTSQGTRFEIAIGWSVVTVVTDDGRSLCWGPTPTANAAFSPRERTNTPRPS